MQCEFISLVYIYLRNYRVCTSPITSNTRAKRFIAVLVSSAHCNVICGLFWRNSKQGQSATFHRERADCIERVGSQRCWKMSTTFETEQGYLHISCSQLVCADLESVLLWELKYIVSNNVVLRVRPSSFRLLWFVASLQFLHIILDKTVRRSTRLVY